MARLRAVTIDGTVIEADQFTNKNDGIRLERKPQSQSGGRGTQKPEVIGFVPYDRLMYVVPEDVTHNVEEFDEIPT